MELTRFDIIKSPLITTKTVDLYKKLGQYTFEVHLDANKPMVREAVEKLWNVKVEKVRIINLGGKFKSFNRRPYKGSDLKKAIVTLVKGHKIEIPGLFEANASQAQSEPQQVAEGN
jgi:large subunit ribosomal protein L23